MKCLLAITIIITAIFLIYPSCENVYSEKIYSSYGESYIQINEMNCHATAPMISSVKIHKPIMGLSIPRFNSKSVFGYEGTINEVEVAWKNNYSVQITNTSCNEVLEKLPSWKNIEVIQVDSCNN